MMLNENDLRLLIRNILQEQEEKVSAIEEPNTQIELADPAKFQNASGAEKARILINVLKSLGIKVRDKSIEANAEKIRLALLDKKDTEELQSAVELAFQEILGGKDVAVDVLPPKEDRNTSSKYNAFSIEGQPLVTFGGDGLETGQRKGGYEYESKIVSAFKESGIDVLADNNMKTSDIEINGAMVELKKIDADAGSPSLAYNFESQEFYPINPTPSNLDTVKMINTTFDKDETARKFNIVKSAIKLDSNNLQLVPAPVFLKTIKPSLSNEKNESMAITKITAKDIVQYYRLKGANFIQVENKGLYHLAPNDKITFSDGRQSLPFDFPGSINGAVTFRKYHESYALRPRITGSPYRKVETSPITLDNSEDRKLFADWAEKQNLNESAQNRWQLLSGIK